ncbi:MAG TPA: BREX system ATP-binding domain-containing protein, partial [Polyangiaceae bacterium]
MTRPQRSFTLQRGRRGMVDGQAGSAIKGGERFELRRRLGEGGAGVVFEAYDRERNEVIAIKTLRGRSTEALVQLKNEFRAVQEIHHPNLVRLGELFEEAGEWFFTMELVAGVDLLAWVRAPVDGAGAVPRFDEGRLRASLAQVTRGLAALHDAGKIHRDVKPSNVLVTSEGRAVVLDFGIAADAVRLERPSEGLQGTIAYIAPEQVAGGPITRAADWYALGVVLYEALTGQPPISGGDVLGRKLSVVPAPPHSLAPGVPPDLEQLCMDLLQIDPRARPEGRDVLARLKAPLEEAPPPPRTSVRVFVGRQRELRALEEAFAETQRGRSVTVAVRGESGVGKSFLVQQFTTEVRRIRADAAILAGRCYERESVPYKAVDGIIDELRHYLWEVPRAEIGKLLPRGMGLLAQLFPVLDTFVPKGDAPPDGPVANPQEQRLRAFGILRSLLGKLAKRTPVVLVIDDLQWADADSLVLL